MIHKYKVGDVLGEGVVVWDEPREYMDAWHILIQVKSGGLAGTSWDLSFPSMIPKERKQIRAMDNLRFVNVGNENPDTYDGYDLD